MAPGGTGAARTPPSSAGEPCQSRAGGAGARGVTWPGSWCGPLPGPTAFPRPTLFPAPCQNPNRIIRPAGCPALPKRKPFPSPARINSPSLDFYKQPGYFFRGSAVLAGGARRARAARRVLLPVAPGLRAPHPQCRSRAPATDLSCPAITSPPSVRMGSGALESASYTANCACAPAPLTTTANEMNDIYFWEGFGFHQSGEWLLISDKGFDSFSFGRGNILVIKPWFNNAAHHTGTALDVASKLCCHKSINYSTSI